MLCWLLAALLVEVMYGESEEECINLTKRLFAFKLSTVVTE